MISMMISQSSDLSMRDGIDDSVLSLCPFVINDDRELSGMSTKTGGDL